MILVMGADAKGPASVTRLTPFESVIMILKISLISLLLLLLVNYGNAGAAAEIGLIKKLLTTIFDRF